jgi:hypothetical protein
VKKIHVLRLHITGRVVELLDHEFVPEFVANRLEALAMKSLLILTAVTVLAAASQGCCRNNFVSRGAPCNTCPTGSPAPCATGSTAYGGDAFMGSPGGMYAPGPG